MERVLDVISAVSIFVLIWALIRGESVAWSRCNRLMKVIGGLKFRLFDLEARVLGSDGVYIPEDMAERYARFVESQLTTEELENIKKRYAVESPPNIPFWKYLVSNYRLAVSIQPYGLITAVEPEIEQLRDGLLRQLKVIKDLGQLVEERQMSLKSLTDMKAAVNDLGGSLSDLSNRLAALASASSGQNEEEGMATESAGEREAQPKSGEQT